jgi:hypothetical protein
LTQQANKNNLEDVIELARQDIAQMGGISLQEAEQLQLTAAQHLFPAKKFRKSMYDIIQQNPTQWLSTGCPRLDSFFGGGIPISCGIVEVCDIDMSFSYIESAFVNGVSRLSSPANLRVERLNFVYKCYYKHNYHWIKEDWQAQGSL